jgi:hypothetical protein
VEAQDVTTLEGFEHDRTGWGGSGAYTDEPDTVTLHSTESGPGSTNGARDWLNKIKAQPHVLTEIRAAAPGGRRKVQMVDLDRAAKALANKPGGIQTNKNGTLQVEIILKAADPYDEVTEADWLWFGREVIGPMCRAKGIPIRAEVAFHDYPPENGHRLGREPWRIVGDETDDPDGLIGHQHWIENLHGDPGNLSRRHYRHGTTSAIDLILEGAGANSEEFNMDAEATEAFRALNKRLESVENKQDRLLADAKTKTSAIGAVRKALGRLEAKARG